VIEASNLSFEYPGTLALDDVSITVADGAVAALVGPNGAGKTTLLKCLAALDRPLSGAITIGDTDVIEEPRQCHRMVGYLSDFFGLYDNLTTLQCLTYVASANGISASDRDGAVKRAAERLDITDLLGNKAGAMSRGQRQRLAIAQAVVHEPKVLLLDEPASGLDPEARHSLSKLFLSLAAEGMTLLVSSHILAELEEYSTEMIILKKGRVVSHESITDDGPSSWTSIRLTIAGPAEALVTALDSKNGVSEVRVEENEAVFNFSGDASGRHKLLKELLNDGLKIDSFAEEKINIHDQYISRMKDGEDSKEDGGDGT
jgi:ABC-2 type transport system ATP-binding protein